jgi:hypothetical protein
MGRRWAGGPTGRYQATCEDGHCALRGGPGRSKLEGQIFTLLDLALGPGISGAPVYTVGGKVTVDMLFPMRYGGIVVEYDGAYFHRHRAAQDWAKSHTITHDSSLHPALVVRIREQPLRRLHRADVSVPPRSNADVCARLAMLHIAHALPTVFGVSTLPSDIEPRIHGFLQAGRDLDPDMVRCRACKRLQRELRHDFEYRWRTGLMIDFRYARPVDGSAVRPPTRRAG